MHWHGALGLPGNTQWRVCLDDLLLFIGITFIASRYIVHIPFVTFDAMTVGNGDLFVFYQCCGDHVPWWKAWCGVYLWMRCHPLVPPGSQMFSMAVLMGLVLKLRGILHCSEAGIGAVCSHNVVFYGIYEYAYIGIFFFLCFGMELFIPKQWSFAAQENKADIVKASPLQFSGFICKQRAASSTEEWGCSALSVRDMAFNTGRKRKGASWELDVFAHQMWGEPLLISLILRIKGLCNSFTNSLPLSLSTLFFSFH